MSKWLTEQQASGEVHVLPISDTVRHDRIEGCICGPTIEPVECDGGSINWLHIHHSLDRREASE